MKTLAILSSILFFTSCERERDPHLATQKATMKQIALALEIYKNDYGESVPIKNLDVVKKILAGENARSKVYFKPARFADEYGRPYVIDNGQIVYRGEDGKLGTEDDIRVPEKK